jgi:hypothetical protein
MLRHYTNTRYEYARRKAAHTGEMAYNRMVEVFPIGATVLANDGDRALIGTVSGHEFNAWCKPLVLVNSKAFYPREVRRLTQAQVELLAQVQAEGGDFWIAAGWLDE